jgi:hypothetical protein
VEATAQVRGGERGVRGEVRLAGIGAGALGAIAMIAFMMAAAALEGSSPLDPIAAVGTTFRGEDAARTGALTIAWGAAVHLLVGAALGMAFAAVVPRDMPLPSSIVLGGGSALFWMAIAVKVLVPAFAPILLVEMPRHGGAWVIAHAVFGAVTGIAPWLRRRIAARPRRAAPERAAPLRPRTSP